MLLLPLYLDDLGAGRAAIGGIMGAASVGGLLFRPAVAWGLDVWGRKPTLIMGTLTLATAMGLVWWITAPGPVAYLVRVIFGMGVGALFTGYFTWAADIVPERRRTEGIALFGVSGLVPLAVNPLSARLGVDPPALRWFLPLMGAVILLSLIPLVLLNEPRRKGKRPTIRVGEVVRALKSPALWSVWLATITFAGLAKTFMAFATVTAGSRGVPTPTDFWLTYAIGAVFVRLFGARLPDRVGPARIVAPAIGLDIVAAWVLMGTYSSAALLTCGLLAGIGHGYCFPVLTSQVVTRSPDHLRGSAVAMFTALWEVCGLVLPPVLGAIADRWDDATMYGAASIVALLCVAGWAVLERRHGTPPPGADQAPTKG